MTKLRALGSEKLSGDDKLKRILELAYYKSDKPNTKTFNNSNVETLYECKTGGVYGIVKEKDEYYIKKGLNESSLDYIGGLFMKNKNKFSSYAEAYKRLNLLKGQEELHEGKKYVLKKSGTSQEESPAPAPSIDSAPAPSPAPAPSNDSAPAPDSSSLGGDTSDTESEPLDNNELPLPTDGEDPEEGMEKEERKKSSYMSEIQKFSGKLGQELRDQKENLESDDIKYVLNMIISAVDLDKLDDDDLEDIGDKFKRDDEDFDDEDFDDEDDLDLGDEDDLGDESDEGDEEGFNSLKKINNNKKPSKTPPQSDETELGEVADQLDNFIHDDLEFEDDYKPSYVNDSFFSKHLNENDENEEKNDEYEIDIDEIENDLNSKIKETLSKYFK